MPRAIDLYRHALALNPKWEDGWWSLGNIYYDTNRYEEALRALTKLVEVNPKSAQGQGLLGLCEFELGKYESSSAHISRSLELGLPGQDQLEGVLRYHQALLLTHRGNFDAALAKYAWFVQKGVQHTALLTAIGLAAIHNTQFPEAVGADQREVFVEAGKAAYLSLTGAAVEARQACRDLVQRFPETPFVHYLYGSLMVSSDPDAGITEMQRELEVSSPNGAAEAMLAWLLIEEEDFTAAAPFAERAVTDEPGLSLARYVYGRCLVEQGHLKEGIQRLEAAEALEPQSLIDHIALAAAYSKAGRSEEARRERVLSLKLAKEDLAASHH